MSKGLVCWARTWTHDSSLPKGASAIATVLGAGKAVGIACQYSLLIRLYPGQGCKHLRIPVRRPVAFLCGHAEVVPTAEFTARVSWIK